MTLIYLDNNATTRIDASVRAALEPYLEQEFGNPSSVHAAGRRARDAVERARDRVAALVGAAREEIVFTSGGTEGDNLAVRGGALAARARDPRRTTVLASPLEHPAVDGALDALARQGFRIERLRVDGAGRIDPEVAVGDDVALVTVQLANHELGNLLPVAELAARARAAGALVHTDAVQAAGKVPIDMRALGVDLLTVSAHKLHGPKGVGAVFVRAGLDLAPHTAGGHQERARRPGTENVPGVVGFGVAAELARTQGPAWSARTLPLRDALQAGAVALGASVNGDLAQRVANTTNLAFPDVPGDLLVEALDLEGIACSTGAACTSGSVEASPILLALGQSKPRASQAVRFSLSHHTTRAEIDHVLAILPALIDRIRRA